MNGNTTHNVPNATQRSEQLLDSIARRLHDGTLCARQVGELGEQYAAAWLESQGWQTLDRNWHCRYGELDIVQGKYSVLDRAVEEDLVPVCLENNITLQAYSPLEQGLLSGTFPRDYVPTGAQCNKKWFQPENMQRAMDMMDAWKPLCDKYGCTIPSLALAWVMNQGDHITLLSGATTADQIAVNAEAAAVPLTDEDLKQMRDMATAIDRD